MLKQQSKTQTTNFMNGTIRLLLSAAIIFGLVASFAFRQTNLAKVSAQNSENEIAASSQSTDFIFRNPALAVINDIPTAASPSQSNMILTPSQTLTVTNANDSGTGSLRAALAAAQDGDLINFSSAFNTPQTINLLTALPDITKSVTIQGTGANLLTVRRDFNAPDFRIFNIVNSITNGVSVSGMTIAGGNAGDNFGGGIFSQTTLTLTNVHVTGNKANSGGGVALQFVDGVFTGCTFSGNTADVGGGIRFDGGGGHTLRLVNSTVSSNSGTINSGGVINLSADGNSRLDVVNSTIANNTGGGILTFTTSGVSNIATTTLRNTIIAGNTPNNLATIMNGGGAAAFQTLGFNLSDNFNGVFTPSSTDITSATPRLAPLALYGGQTPTHALLAGSPAIDAGNSSGSTTDQRGRTRPFDTPGAANVSDGADIGATEMQLVIVNNASDSLAGSLRDAVNNAPTNSDILFDPTVFNVARTITLTTGELVINKNLNIIGTGANLLTVSGNNASRILNAASGFKVAISGITFSNGNAPGTDVTGYGGAILSSSDLTLTNVAVTGNTAGRTGGGVRISDASGTFSNSVFSGNTAGNSGGGISFGSFNSSIALTLTNCTVSGNTANGAGSGGGVFGFTLATPSSLTVQITNSTITGNSGIDGGGLRIGAQGATAISTGTVRNTLFANNTTSNLKTAVALGGTANINSQGFNLSSDGGGGFLNVAPITTDKINANAALAPLALNGGTTPTHALLFGSAALDAGNNSGSGVLTDQRGIGFNRTVDLPIANAPNSDGTDIGAFEAQTAPAAPTISINDVSQNEGNSGTSNFTFTVSLSAASSSPVTVSYQTADGTAMAGSDYTAIGATTLTFAAGETSKQISVSVNGDTTVEPDETFFVNLSNPTGATIADNQGQGTILNDDSCPSITLGSLSNGTVGVSYNGSVAASPANTYSYSVTTGTLPNGLALNATNGAVIGTPTIAGSFSFTITATAGSCSGNNGYNITISPAPTTARTRFDFDGDGKADVSVFRPSTGTWYLLQSQNGFTGAAFGLSNDIITPADFDGDGKTDFAVYRSGIWYIQRSQLGFTGVAFGAATDIPMPADFDGDGKADLGVFRPSNGGWYIYNLATNQTSSFAFGQAGDVPVAADYDGDGKADIAVFRSGTWYLQRSTLGFTGIAFGQAGDKPVPADYDGDGKTDVAVFRSGTWYLLQSTAGFTGVNFGTPTDIPTAADYDGDGRADVAVFRPSTGTWFLQRSTAGFTGVAFGTNGDKPVPSAFVP